MDYINILNSENIFGGWVTINYFTILIGIVLLIVSLLLYRGRIKNEGLNLHLKYIMVIIIFIDIITTPYLVFY